LRAIFLFIIIAAAVVISTPGCCGKGSNDEIGEDTGPAVTERGTTGAVEVSDLKITLDVTSHIREGRMLVTEEFTLTAGGGAATFTISDNADTRPTAGELKLADGLLRKYGAGYEGPLLQNEIPDLAPFAVYKDGAKQPATVKGFIQEGPSHTAAIGTAETMIKLGAGETAVVKVVKHGYFYTDAPFSIEDYYFVYDLASDFGGVPISGATVTANFDRTPTKINTPERWTAVKDTGKNKTWEIEAHAPDHEAYPDDGYLGDDAPRLVMTYPADDKVYLTVLAANVNFREEPNPDAPRVTGKETLVSGEKVELIEIDGDWYNVDADGARGWVRWRYRDPDTGKTNVYVEEFEMAY
jgi:hypothetical protein